MHFCSRSGEVFSVLGGNNLLASVHEQVMTLEVGPAAIDNRLFLPIQAKASLMSSLPFEEVVRVYLPVVWRVLRRAGVAEADCDDVCQEVFCVYAEKEAKVKPGSERAFALSIAVRKASDYRRGAYRQRHRLESSPGESQVAHGETPEAALERREGLAELDSILTELPGEFRDVFVLLEIEQMTTKEAAGALGVPTGTISSRMHRARERFDKLLRERLEKGGRQ